MRIAGTLVAGACYVPILILIPGLPELQWNWPLPGSVQLGAILASLPGAALVALLAPLVSYRRRDALTVIFFPPAGLRIAWIIGTRLGQLPHRNWPTREDVMPVQGRHYAWIAIAGNRYRLWREKRAELAAGAATPAAGHSGRLPGSAAGDVPGSIARLCSTKAGRGEVSTWSRNTSGRL